MKSVVMRSILVGFVVMMAAGLASAQTFTKINPPPCDFSNQFYGDNGVLACTDSTCTTLTGELNTEPDGRFGSFRRTGPPATGSQVNWVADTNCAANDPTRRNFRILATTGAFKDDSGAPTEFFSIIAFVHAQSFFEQSYSRTVGANFEAYTAPKQKITFNGKTVVAPTPCGSMFDPDHAGLAPAVCFPVADTKDANGNTISGVATPNLRHDWRVSSNRNAMDGSDNNCITSNDQLCKHKGSFSDSPFGYFCDDLLGMWIVTYFWYTENAVGGTTSTGGTITPTANCNHVLACIHNIYGDSLDGTPIIKTGDQLHFLEGVPGTAASVFPGQGVPGACLQDADLPPASAVCGQEGSLDPTGTDNGAVWLVCPVIQDPRNGAIATDAFLDAVRTSGGAFLDSGLANNFTCLQQTGKFCGE